MAKDPTDPTIEIPETDYCEHGIRNAAEDCFICIEDKKARQEDGDED